eukprot:9478001-Pyramimonas_sp.AAC.1
MPDRSPGVFRRLRPPGPGQSGAPRGPAGTAPGRAAGPRWSGLQTRGSIWRGLFSTTTSMSWRGEGGG